MYPPLWAKVNTLVIPPTRPAPAATGGPRGTIPGSLQLSYNWGCWRREGAWQHEVSVHCDSNCVLNCISGGAAVARQSRAPPLVLLSPCKYQDPPPLLCCSPLSCLVLLYSTKIGNCVSLCHLFSLKHERNAKVNLFCVVLKYSQCHYLNYVGTSTLSRSARPGPAQPETAINLGEDNHSILRWFLNTSYNSYPNFTIKKSILSHKSLIQWSFPIKRVKCYLIECAVSYQREQPDPTSHNSKVTFILPNTASCERN